MSIFVEFDETGGDHRISVHPKRKHRLHREELADEIESIKTEYITWMNELYIRAEPSLQETSNPLANLHD